MPSAPSWASAVDGPLKDDVLAAHGASVIRTLKGVRGKVECLGLRVYAFIGFGFRDMGIYCLTI